jgi:hypothetical protein
MVKSVTQAKRFSSLPFSLLTAARKWPETGGQKIPEGNQTTRVCVVAPA